MIFTFVADEAGRVERTAMSITRQPCLETPMFPVRRAAGVTNPREARKLTFPVPTLSEDRHAQRQAPVGA